MKPAQFNLLQPTTLEQAHKYLKESAGLARIMAGGQSLVPMLNLRLVPADLIISISQIDELKAVSAAQDGVNIGACVTHAEIEDGRIKDPIGGFMSKVASTIAYRAIRNQGTIGGSLALADPSAEWVTLMIALDATLNIFTGTSSNRTIKAKDYMHGAYYTSIGDYEILKSLHKQPFSKNAQFGFDKLSRKRGEFAYSLAIAVRDRDIGFSRIVIGATEAAPILLPQASELLKKVGGQFFEREQSKMRVAIRNDFQNAGYLGDRFVSSIQETSVLRAITNMVNSSWKK